jgi:hypothetical protein
MLVVAASAQSRVAVGSKAQGAKKAVNTARAEELTEVYFNLIGVQNDAGICYKNIDKCVGNTFVLSGETAPYSAVMTISMDYDGFPSLYPGNALANGSWSLVISKDGSYYGTVFGEIQSGAIRWIPDPMQNGMSSRTTEATLKILGGIDGYEQNFTGEEPVLDFSSFTKFGEDPNYTAAEMVIGL